jgi:GntR family histidine utilization transcriptional repressor
MVRRTAPPKPALAPYARVKQHLRDALATGRWPPGTLMPSEAELVAQFGVSRMTVNRALRELQTEGLVERTQGVGTFAAQLGKVASQLTIRDLHEEISERGHQHRSVVHRARAERASAALAAQLGLATGARVFHTLIVHLENELPLQCEDRYVNPVAAPEYLSVDFTRTTPTHYLLEVAPLWQAQYSIEGDPPNGPGGSAAGHRRRRTLSRGGAPHGRSPAPDHAGPARASRPALSPAGRVRTPEPVTALRENPG